MPEDTEPGRPPPGDEPESHPGLLGVVMRGAGLSGAGYILAQALTLATYIVLARLLTPNDFGIFAAATTLLGFTLLITESGFVSAVIQRRDRFEEAANTALIGTLVNGVVFGLLALAAAPLLGLFFDSDTVTKIAAAMSGIVFLRVASAVPDAILQRQFSFLRRLVIEPVQVIAFAAAAILAARNDFGPWSLVIGMYAGTVTDVVFCWALVRWRPHPRQASFAMWRELAGFGRHVFTATAILRAGEQSDALIIGRVIGTSALGQFRYAFRLASAPFLLLLATASYVLYPAFARIAEERERFLAAFHRSMRWMCMLAFPAGMLLVPLGIPLAVILFGEVWRDAGEAAMAMSAYTAGSIISSVVSEALKAEGRPDRLTRMHTVNAVLTLGSMLALAPVSLTAAAAGMSIGALGAAAYAVRQARIYLGADTRSVLADLWPPALASLVMAGAVFGLEQYLNAEAQGDAQGAVLIGVEGLVGVGVYLVFLRLCSARVFDEIRWGAHLVRARIAQGPAGDPGN